MPDDPNQTADEFEDDYLYDDEGADYDAPADGPPPESPDAALPSSTLYLGSIVALLIATAVGVFLIVSPPEERSSPPVSPDTGEEVVSGVPTATPTPTREALTPTSIASATATAGDASATASGTATPGDATPTGTPTPEDTEVYVIQEGEFLFDIALAHDVTVNDLLALNPGLDPNLLTPGQEILVPAPAGEESDDGGQ